MHITLHHHRDHHHLYVYFEKDIALFHMMRCEVVFNTKHTQKMFVKGKMIKIINNNSWAIRKAKAKPGKRLKRFKSFLLILKCKQREFGKFLLESIIEKEAVEIKYLRNWRRVEKLCPFLFWELLLFLNFFNRRGELLTWIILNLALRMKKWTPGHHRLTGLLKKIDCKIIIKKIQFKQNCL